MRVEGKFHNGKPTGATIRRVNYKNQEVIGKKGVQKLKEKGKKGVLKMNFHSKIGGHTMELRRKGIQMEAHANIDEQLREAEDEFHEQMEASNKTF